MRHVTSIGCLPSRTPGIAKPLDDEASYRELFDRIDQGLCIIEMLFDERERPVDYRFLHVNAAFTGQSGLRDVIGRTMRELRPKHEEHWFEIFGRVAVTGEPASFDAPASALDRWFDVYAFPFDAPERRRVAVLFRDMTQAKRDEEYRAVLARETRHRTNNLLTVLTSIVNLTDGENVRDYKAKLIGRIHALNNSQRFLRENQGESASLSALVELELGAYRTEDHARTHWEGPPVSLDPPQAQSMAMALHELATNATKYGALSNPEGHVEVVWHLKNDRVLHLRWAESGGPPVTPPKRSGMGTGIITAVIEGQLGGAVTFDWQAQGLICDLSMPAAASKA